MKTENQSSPRDHLANERTFLAWIRTTIGIMAFGFLIEKFSLIMNEGKRILGVNPLPEDPSLSVQKTGIPLLGVLFVCTGMLLAFFSLLRYRKAEKQIEKGNYKSSMLLIHFLTIVAIFIGLAVILLSMS